tara:strand:- start:235 stop:732 length:498 start_codon:yes stop_codon:yes gene_type:complete
MNISELRDFKLTQEEWHTLMHNRELFCDPAIVDVLVLAGLAEWDIGEFAREEGEWLLTDAGRAACDAIDMIFNWEEFAFNPAKSVEEQDTVSVLLSDPKRMTVGSLVRHKTTGGVGLITQHGMWDADWGSFRVQFNKPVDNVINGRVVNQLSHITDRADKFEFTY